MKTTVILISFHYCKRNKLTIIFPVDVTYDYDYLRIQAQCAHIFESDATREFLDARGHPWLVGWKSYKTACRMRHKWGLYFRSNIDWDRDTTKCLKRLFELPERVPPLIAPIATVDQDAVEADTWNVFTQANLPKQMKVTYKSVTGETKYRTIMICPSSDDVTSAREVSQDVGEQDNKLRISPELRSAGVEVVDGPGVIMHKSSVAEPVPQTNSDLGAKQVIKKQEVSVDLLETSCGGAQEAGEGSEVVVNKR